MTLPTVLRNEAAAPTIAGTLAAARNVGRSENHDATVKTQPRDDAAALSDASDGSAESPTHDGCEFPLRCSTFIFSSSTYGPTRQFSGRATRCPARRTCIMK